MGESIVVAREEQSYLEYSTTNMTRLTVGCLGAQRACEMLQGARMPQRISCRGQIEKGHVEAAHTLHAFLGTDPSQPRDPARWRPHRRRCDMSPGEARCDTKTGP